MDLTQYTGARVAVNLHVGSSLAVDGYVIKQFATFVDEAKETPISYYTVTATAQDGGSVSGAPAEKVAEGEQVTLIAAPDDMYTFAGWYNTAANTLVSMEKTYTFTVTGDIALTARFTAQSMDDGHKREPDAPAAAVGTKDSDKAAVRVRVNGSWYGAYIEDYKGQTSIWVPVNIDISKLNANAVNYFSFSSNVINQGNYSGSSIDLFASTTKTNLTSFSCSHQYCDAQYTKYSDRNINVRLELYNGSSWVTAVPQEETYYDYHEVLGFSSGDNQWYNAARNLQLNSLDGYTAARMMIQLHIGNQLEVDEEFKEKSFATFLPAQYTVTVTAGEGGTVDGAPAGDVAFGETVTVTATPAEDYTFDGWYNTGLLVSRDATYTFSVTRSSDLTARFTKGTTQNTNSFRVLVIGNSHSDDAMAYVWNIATELGYDDVRIGVLYIGGCDIATHVECANNDSPSYEYRSNVDGTWQNIVNVRMREGIQSEDWDYIVLQNSAPKAGVPDEYSKVQQLIDYVKALAPNAALAWHTGFAWRDVASITVDPPYQSSDDMYYRIIDTVKNEIVPNSSFSKIIYTATAVQNASSSAISRILYRDAAHLSIPLGRYIASLFVTQTLTGKSVEGIVYAPEGVSEDEKTIALAAVKRAIENPQEITKFESEEVFHKNKPDAPGSAEFDSDSDKAAIRVRVNGNWYGAYIDDYKGQDSVWVPVYLDISKLKSNEENYFHFSSNVLSHGNFTGSSVDLYSSFAAGENLNSFLTQHPYCDEGWMGYSDRNINVRLELYDGQKWVTVAPQESTYYDEHTVLGQFANNGNWYNAGRNLVLGDLSGYTDARMLVQLHVGTNLDVTENYKEEAFATFIQAPDYADNPKTGDSMLLQVILLVIAVLAVAVLSIQIRRNIYKH